jgi:hypothetical protein
MVVAVVVAVLMPLLRLAGMVVIMAGLVSMVVVVLASLVVGVVVVHQRSLGRLS